MDRLRNPDVPTVRPRPQVSKKIAIGYRWGMAAAGYHLERACDALGHSAVYVGLPYRERSGYDGAMALDQLLAQVCPDADLFLWIDSAGKYFPPGIERLPIPTACYLIDVHLGKWRHEVAKFFDGVFVAQKDYVPVFRDTVGHDQVYWLPLAAAADVHRMHCVERTLDVGFVGNVSRAHGPTARVRRLKLLENRYQTNDFYQGYLPDQVGRVYSESRIVFNTSIAGDVTMRVFEGTACGALLLTDSVANGLEDLFELGHEIVVFQDDQDLIDKIDYYLSHPEEREQIARAGYERTVSCHTYQHRVQSMVDQIDDSCFVKCAPMRNARERERVTSRREVLTHLHMLDTVLDEARSAGQGALQRLWVALPCLVRRLLV